MTPPISQSQREEIQQFLDTCSLTEKLVAHDPRLGARLRELGRERASILQALADHPQGTAQGQLLGRIRILQQALADIERDGQDTQEGTCVADLLERLGDPDGMARRDHA